MMSCPLKSSCSWYILFSKTSCLPFLCHFHSGLGPLWSLKSEALPLSPMVATAFAQLDTLLQPADSASLPLFLAKVELAGCHNQSLGSFFVFTNCPLQTGYLWWCFTWSNRTLCVFWEIFCPYHKVGIELMLTHFNCWSGSPL